MLFDSPENQGRKLRVLRDFKEFLENIGVQPGRLDRLIDILSEEHSRPTVKDLARIARAFSEADELILIFLSLPNLNEMNRRFWCHIFDRPESGKSLEYVDARDRQYEVWLTAFLTRAGLAASWSRDHGDKADLELTFENTLISVSAKRPESRESLPNALRNAITKLSSQLKGDPKAIGIVAVNLDNAWSDYIGLDKILQGSEKEIADRVNRFWADLRPQAAATMNINHRRIAGMMITLNVTALENLQDDGRRFTTVTRYQFEDSSDRKPADFPSWAPFLERLGRAFQPDRFDVSKLPRTERHR